MSLFEEPMSDHDEQVRIAIRRIQKQYGSLGEYFKQREKEEKAEKKRLAAEQWRRIEEQSNIKTP